MSHGRDFGVTAKARSGVLQPRSPEAPSSTQCAHHFCFLQTPINQKGTHPQQKRPSACGLARPTSLTQAQGSTPTKPSERWGSSPPKEKGGPPKPSENHTPKREKPNASRPTRRAR